MSGAANAPAIEAYIGASGSGKGVSIKRRLRALQPARVLVWDPRDEYEGHGQRVATLRTLVQAWEKAGAGPCRVRYVPGKNAILTRDFAYCAELAFAAGNMVFLAEELSDVTTASRAPDDWRRLCTQGRHRAVHIIGAAQRPALIDKNFLGQATYIRCFTLRYHDDRRAMAKALDVDQAAIDALRTEADDRRTVIHYIERDFRAPGAPVLSGSIRLAR